MSTFELNFLTPEKKILWNQEVEEVFVPGHNGEMNILPSHSPLMTTLTAGVLKYRLKGESKIEKAIVTWGYCEVTPKGVNILAETAETQSEVDLVRAENAEKKAIEMLADPTLDATLVRKYTNKLQRAELRKELAKETSH